MMVKLSTSTNITIRSSWEGSTPLKSSFVNVISGILGRMAIELTWWTAQRCFFLTLLELPPPANPPAMVFMTSRPLLRSSFGGSSLRVRRSCRQSFSLALGGVWSCFNVFSRRGERLVACSPCTKRHKCPTCISSSILSFKVWHSSVK